MKTDYLAPIQKITQNNVPPCDFHMHTRWTDGEADASRMYEAAQAAKLDVILFSEHARKTSGDWFGKFAAEVRALKGATKALVGVETKVESLSGDLDSTDEILDQCDLVMASVHRFPGEKGQVRGFDEVQREEALETEFRLACAILKNPRVDILAHPFGMCYRRFGVIPPAEKIRELIRETAKTRVAFEINCHYHPNPWQLVEWCRQLGARMSLGSNAHHPGEVGRIVRILEGREAAWVGLAS